jgi:hypothetical protein
MNLAQRLVTQPGFHGVPPGGVNAALIGLHPVFQYGLGAITYPLKSHVAFIWKRSFADKSVPKLHLGNEGRAWLTRPAGAFAL